MNGQTHRDLVAPFVFGYYTRFWFGDRLGPSGPSLEEALSFGGTLCSLELERGIRACAFENGSILFDFSRCPETPIILHRESLWNDLDRTDLSAVKAVGARLQRTERRQRTNQQFFRSVLIAHTLLLQSAARTEANISLETPRLETLNDAVACHALAKTWSRHAIPKFNLALPKKVVERSLYDLNELIVKGENVLRTVELYRLARYRQLDHRFAECLVLCWTVCENIVDYIWRRMIQNLKSSNPTRMTKKRIEVLSNTSAFTASVRIETLELSGFISVEQAEALNTVRKARNNWLHSLEDVEEMAALQAAALCLQLISSIHGVTIAVPSGGSGGEGGGMFLDVFKARHPEFDLSVAYDGLTISSKP